MEKRRSKLIVYWTNLGSCTRRSRVTEHLMGSNIWLSNFSCRCAIPTSFLALWSPCPKSWRSNTVVAMKHHNSSLDDEIDSQRAIIGNRPVADSFLKFLTSRELVSCSRNKHVFRRRSVGCFSRRERRAYLDRYVRSEQRGKTANWPPRRVAMKMGRRLRC